MIRELKSIPIELLTPGKYQTRADFSPSLLNELAISIKRDGLIQPIIVRPIKDKGYEIIAGERRWRAAQLAGLEAIPCLVGAYENLQAAVITTIENIQRRDLNPIEEAHAYRNIVDEFGYTHEEVAAIIGKPRSVVTNLLRLLKLDQRVQNMLIQGSLCEAHGKILAGLPLIMQYELALQCVQHSWTQKRLEQEARQRTITKSAKFSDPNITMLERKISDKLGVESKIEILSDKSGWLKVRFFDNDILSGILEKLGIGDE